jgi:GNAT superfamily N-acetyltransferase
MPFRRYRKRARYLDEASVGGLRKEVLFMDRDAVGMIEYAPASFSAYPISGDGVWVMNCIWVLRRAKGHRFGKMLMRRMLETAEDATGFATVALEGHKSPWLKLPQMEYLGFRSVDSRMMHHKVKWPEICFRVHLMWMPLKEGADPPVMDWKGLLRGVELG